jgi:aminopeptidase N
MQYSNLQDLMMLLRFALALTATLAFADNYPRQPGIDVQHYVFRITLSDDTDEIYGEATVAMRFVQEGVKQAALDLTSAANGKGMTVTEVTSNSTPVSYTHTADRLVIGLPITPKAGELRRYTIKYHGVAGSGLHIAKNKFGDRTFFSWNWPVLARQWLPTIDHPYDKATSEFLITAPARYQVVANGLLQEELDLAGGRRMTHWKQSVPIATWLNNIGVAQFATRHLGDAAGVPLQTWVFPKDRANGIVTFGEPMRQAIEFFTEYIGPYPYEKLASVQVSEMGGGMEHASAIFYGEKSVGNRPAFSLVAHEVSHQWWGDSVTENDWDDAWLSEGFATYFASLATEHYQGRDAFVSGMKRSRAGIFQMEKHNPGVAVIHNNLPEIETGRAPVGIVYQKGGWVLHMLRGVLGDTKFREGLREYYRRFRDRNTSTGDLRRVMEETSGMDLGWFFEQWLMRAGSPALESSWTYHPADRTITLDLTQTQPGDAFRLPMEIAIALPGMPTSVIKIEMAKKSQRFSISSAAPASLEIDPNVWVLMDVKATMPR